MMDGIKGDFMWDWRPPLLYGGEQPKFWAEQLLAEDLWNKYLRDSLVQELAGRCADESFAPVEFTVKIQEMPHISQRIHDVWAKDAERNKRASRNENYHFCEPADRRFKITLE